MRVAAVIGAIIVVVIIARLIGGRRRPSHPPIDVAGLGERPGVVVFTSTDCSTCSETMRMVAAMGAPTREVTWELEPHLFERCSVEAVPLVIVLDADGRSTYFETGVPKRGDLNRAIRGAGLA